MKNYILIAVAITFILLLSFSCSYKKANCDILTDAIVNNNERELKSEINKLCASYKPFKTGADAYGQEKNFSKLAQQLSYECIIEVSEVCYACIKTEPPVSTMKVSFQIDTTHYVKTLEISLTPYNRLQYKGIRD